MLPYPVILTITIVGLLVMSVIAIISSGSIFSVFVVLALAALVAFLLQVFGVIDFKWTSQGPDLSFHENAPVPYGKKKKLTPTKPVEGKEVFYVSGDQFTYNDAPAVCAAYGADLATYDQVNDAFGKGAEWCGYGWSQGGMALFPTQSSTWQAMQNETSEEKRTACGRPGVNGGYFDPRMKFGVNCYGSKSSGKGFKLPLPLPGFDQKAFDNSVNKFKSMLKSFTVSPFNRKVWTEYDVLKEQAQELKTGIQSGVSGLGADIQAGYMDVLGAVESL
jgi:hypothetical protein